MTCLEANFFRDIEDLRLDVYAVHEKKVLCCEEILASEAVGRRCGPACTGGTGATGGGAELWFLQHLLSLLSLRGLLPFG